MRGHSSLVFDSNNGQIIGDEFDYDLNQRLGVHIDDDPGSESAKARVDNSVKKATKKQQTAEAELKKVQDRLSSTRRDLADLKQKAERAKEKAREKRREENESSEARWTKKKNRLDEKKQIRINNTNNRINLMRQQRVARGLPPVDVNKERLEQQKLDAYLRTLDASLKTFEDQSEESLEKRLRKIDADEEQTLRKLNNAMRKADVDSTNADFKATRAARDVEAMKIRVQAAGVERVFANIFDYEATIKRIKTEILGDLYDDYSQEAVRSKLADVMRDAYYQGGYWRRVLRWPSSKGKQEVKDIDDHANRCRINVCSSLCISADALFRDSPMVLRFMNTFSPVRPKRGTDFMRFASFVVPDPATWRGVSARSYEVLRVLPQMAEFSRDLVSSFGNVTILQPATLPRSHFEDQPNAIASVEQAQLALRRVRKLYSIISSSSPTRGAHGVVAHARASLAARGPVCGSREHRGLHVSPANRLTCAGARFGMFVSASSS